MKELFNSDRDYQRYLYCKKLAEKVNTYLDKGYIVLDQDGNKVAGKFVFEEDGSIGLKDGNWTYGYFGDEWYDNGKIYGCPKKQIDEMFSKFDIVKPSQCFKIVKNKKVRKTK